MIYGHIFYYSCHVFLFYSWHYKQSSETCPVSRIESTTLLNSASKQIMSFPSVVPHLMAFIFHVYRPDHICLFEPLLQNIIIHNLVFFQPGGHFAVPFMSSTNNPNTAKFFFQAWRITLPWGQNIKPSRAKFQGCVHVSSFRDASCKWVKKHRQNTRVCTCSRTYYSSLSSTAALARCPNCTRPE